MATHRRSKQKSCFSCVARKRRCDQTLPYCTRCVGQGIDCAYPSPPTSTSRPTPRPTPTPTLTPTTTSTNRSEPGSGWSNLGAFDAAFGGDDNMAASSSSLQQPRPPARDSVTVGASALTWFTHPSTWKTAHHYQPSEAYPSPPSSQDVPNFVRGLRSWLLQFQREGHCPFIHQRLYPARAIPDCIQDAYSAIAVSQGAGTDNENMVDIITSSYASRLMSSQATLMDQPLHLVTVKDHLARTQSLLIHLLLALSSSSLDHQTKAGGLVDTLHRWKGEMLASAEQEASIAQVFPCSPSIPTAEMAGPDLDSSVPDLHRAFVICESIRRTWLLCSMAIGVYRSLRGDWTASACGGDIRFTARAGLWDTFSSARWAKVAREKDPLFDFSLRGGALAKSGIPAVEVDEFAHHLFSLIWGTDKVESWFGRAPEPNTIVR